MEQIPKPVPDELPDALLIQRCGEGDQRSFALLYRRYQQRIRSTLYQLCGPTHLDDLVQEVFLRAWKGLPKLREGAYFSTWIYRITWNVATDQRRSHARQATKLQALQQVTEKTQVSTHLMDLHYQDLVQRGLEHLQLDHRAVLVLHDLEAIPQKDIAEILGIPVGTVKSRLFRARSSIRTFLEQAGVQP